MMDLKKTVLGIELGSTRIKAVLIDEGHLPIAQGDFEWENQLVNGVWTYSMEMVHRGVQTGFANLKADVKEKCGRELSTVGAIGVSGENQTLRSCLILIDSKRKIAYCKSGRPGL